MTIQLGQAVGSYGHRRYTVIKRCHNLQYIPITHAQ